jgi:hypothetical protein
VEIGRALVTRIVDRSVAAIRKSIAAP